MMYSESALKFYIGSTSTRLEIRLTQHLSNHSGFTSKAKDWKIVYSESYSSVGEARKREQQLKKWKSSERIKQLISRSSTE